jgi:1-acyl-sn-glycerol-3-phosphate acyltransferase
MNRIRGGLYAVWLYAGTFLLMVVYMTLLPIPRRAGMRPGLRLWARLVTWGMRVIGGVRLEVRGLEKLPQGSYLLAAKHQSMFDVVPPFLFATDCVFVMKKELARIPLFGWLSQKARMIRVDRQAQAKAMRALIADAQRLMAEPRQLLIFPEGTRHPPGAPADYKPGVAALYRELGLPCVPLATNSGLYLDSGGLVLKAGTVVVQILDPIAPGLKRAEFMTVLQERIETASAALLRE